MYVTVIQNVNKKMTNVDDYIFRVWLTLGYPKKTVHPIELIKKSDSLFVPDYEN